MALTQFGEAWERAKRTGKPHIWWDGGYWNAVTPEGGSGHLADRPDKALRWANGAIAKLDWLEKVSRTWLATDPDAPAPNTRIVC